MNEPLPKHQFSKILVFRYQQRIPLVCQRQHGIVLDSGLHLRHGYHLVTFVPQSLHHTFIEVLVCQQNHAACPVRG